MAERPSATRMGSGCLGRRRSLAARYRWEHPVCMGTNRCKVLTYIGRTTFRRQGRLFGVHEPLALVGLDP